MSNRLASESSPYLRQHRDNPVDWYPWGEDAFAAARRRNVPILLSVGYSACHWCHVMAHESFEDPETARLMNALFVNVKVDREERPDVDALYMDAVQALTGRGGWPMTVFLSTDARPFFGGTYYPRPAFQQLLRAVDDAWRNRRPDIDSNADALVEILGRSALAEPDPSRATIDAFHGAVRTLLGNADREWGGFGRAPKFPSTMNLGVLLRAWLDGQSRDVRGVVTTTLDAMASGGMYDHVGGGFARYSVDERWLVPHFEKMLYDQALLARTYLHAASAIGNPEWLQVAEETIGYVLRDLSAPEGGFYSSEDADSAGDDGHHHEGRFYVFTPDEVRAAVPGPDGEALIEWFGIDGDGNFEGRSIPTRMAARGRFARPPHIEAARAVLFDARAGRPRPGLDDKVLAEWNGMMLATLAEAAWICGRADWLERAEANGRFLLEHLRDPDGTWRRSWQRDAAPRARHLALAADLAQLTDGFTRLAEATGRAQWLDAATGTADALLDRCWDPERGGLFTVPRGAEPLVARQKDLDDNAVPSANSAAAVALLRLGALTGTDRYLERADDILALLAPLMAGAPTAAGHALAAVHLRHVGTTEVVVAGDRPDLLAALRRRWLPTVVVAHGERTASPLWTGRDDGRAYVCRSTECLAPSSTPDELLASLRTALGG